jgi:hypothetical protein
MMEQALLESCKKLHFGSGLVAKAEQPNQLANW